MMKTPDDNLPEPVPQCGAGETRTCRYCETVKPVGEMSTANKCKACKRACNRVWNDANKERIKAYSKAWRDAKMDANPGYRKAYWKAWIDANPGYRKAYTRKVVRNLSNTYLKKLLVQGTTLKFFDIPQDMVEIKRLHLKIHRQLKTTEL